VSAVLIGLTRVSVGASLSPFLSLSLSIPPSLSLSQTLDKLWGVAESPEAREKVCNPSISSSFFCVTPDAEDQGRYAILGIKQRLKIG